MIGVTEIVLVPIEIIGIVNLCKRLSERFGDLLHQCTVKHSTNMWFLHVFLIPYCLDIGKNKFIAYILLVLFSLLCSMVINYIARKIKFINLKIS
jgi:hypothetical protein